jgi:hypothetical protein
MKSSPVGLTKIAREIYSIVGGIALNKLSYFVENYRFTKYVILSSVPHMISRYVSESIFNTPLNSIF